MTGIGLVGLALGAGAEVPEVVSAFNIRITAPTMVAALIQFSEQTGLQLVFPTDGAADLAAPSVEGRLTSRAALEQLLRNSGLTYQFVNDRTVSVSVGSHEASGRNPVPASVAR